jgi:sugar lactone lactonase YvrE
MDGESVELKTTSLVRVDPDGSAHEAASDLSFPNGTVIFPDGKTIVVGESLGMRMTAFDLNPDGTLTNQRVWAQFPAFGSEGAIAPDGSCLDADGCIWVANALGPECVRVAEGGQVRGRVRTSQGCYACMLGGEDRRTLYCLTAPSSHAAHLTGKTDGRIERIRVDVPGDGLP